MTLPEDVLQEAGVEPGDMVAFRAVGPGTVEIRVLERLTPAEALEQFKIEGPLDKAPRQKVRQHESAAETVEPKDLPPLTLAEMIARFRIEGPIDEAADRELWEAEAAKDVIGE